MRKLNVQLRQNTTESEQNGVALMVFLFQTVNIPPATSFTMSVGSDVVCLVIIPIGAVSYCVRVMPISTQNIEECPSSAQQHTEIPKVSLFLSIYAKS